MVWVWEKHMEAINGFMGSKVKIICEKDKKSLIYKKKYPKMIVTSDEETIFKDKQINLVSIASYDNYHFDQILKCLKNEKKNIIVEKPMCLNPNQLKRIYSLIKTKRTKMTSNLVLRVNSLFKEFKKKNRY